MITTDSKSKFAYNPFSVVNLESIETSIVPRLDINFLKEKIESRQQCHIELLGKKGRGKTTHLKWIANHFPEYPIYLLGDKMNLDELMSNPSEIIFIDSIHHLPFIKRLSLFKSKKTIVFTTHWTRKIECLIANSTLYSVRMNGIDKDALKEILNKRLLLASKGTLAKSDLMSSKNVEDLIASYKDDYRAIMYHMYDKFQP